MTLQIPPGGGSSPPLAYADTEPDGVPIANDPAVAMLALILQSRGAQSAAATQDANHAKEMIDQTRRQIQEATKRAAEAEEHKGFWDKLGSVFSGEIGTLCEIVAAVAVSVATGGVGAAGALALTAAKWPSGPARVPPCVRYFRAPARSRASPWAMWRARRPCARE